MRSTFLSCCAGFVILASTLGCGGGGGTPTTTTTPPPTPPPTVSSFSATPATITQGQNSTLSWVVSGASSLTISNGVGAVAGTSVSVSPSTTTTYTLTAANSTGNATATANVTVNPAPSFTLMASPSTLSLKSGASGNAAIMVNALNGFTSTVTFTLTGAPSGVVPTFTPNPATSSSNLALQVALTVAPGTYPLVIRGNSSGLAEQTASLSLTVTDATSLTPEEQAGQMVRNVLRMGQFSMAPGFGGIPALIAPNGDKAPLALRDYTTCYTITTDTSNPNHVTMLMDFTNCQDFTGSIGYVIDTSAAGYVFNTTFTNFGYSFTLDGNLFASRMNGVISSTGSMGPGGQSYTYTVITQGPFTSQWTYGGHTYAYTFSMNETFNINFNTLRFSTSGTYSYSDASGTWTITVPAATPMVADYMSGCLYPISGTMNIVGPSGAFSATFGPTCGTVTINPGNYVINL